MTRSTRRLVGTLALSGVLASGAAAGASAAPSQGGWAPHPRPAASHHVTHHRTRVAAATSAATLRTAAATTTNTSTATTTNTSPATGTSTATPAATSGVTLASTTSISTAGLSANAITVLRAINGTFPQITTIGGIRTGAGAEDHATGHALDLMIPDPTSASGKALGDQVAAFLQAHASELGVKYVIWRQHIWSVQRASEGWRAMADRGSATANHYDHVHVSVN